MTGRGPTPHPRPMDENSASQVHASVEGSRTFTRRGFLSLLGAGAALGLTGQLSASHRTVSGTVVQSLPSRVLGRTGERVPILGLGTALLGNRLVADEAMNLLQAAVDRGVTYIDTAPAIGGYGHAQAYIGEALRERRSEIFLVSKCYEAEVDAARRLLESSLRELQTDTVDLVCAHSIGADKMVPEVVFGPQGVFRALQRAKEEGLARHIGASGHNRPARFVRAVEEVELEVMMNAVNFVDAHTYDFEGRVWPLARARGLGLVAMKVFGGGQRGRARMPEGWHELALRYALSLEGCATAVVGMGSVAELEENVERVRRYQPLSEQERTELEGVGRELARVWGAHFGPAN